jgi:flagellar biosynthesis repressor protein FlbT
MRKGFRISLRAGERIYVNGAVLQPDRKVSLEFLNDVAFLLESHVILADETTTPLRQLYFVVQTMLMDPANAPTTRGIFEKSHALLMASFENDEILDGLKGVGDHVRTNRVYEALRVIRTLLPLEDAILGKNIHAGKPVQEVA